MLVEAVMTTDVVGVPIGASLRAAVERMLAERVGSVIAADDGDPAGIVTETDVLLAGYRTEEPLDAIRVREAMSTPLVTVAPDATVRSAVERMRTEEVKKLPVLDGLDLVGILTLTDIVHHHEEFIGEAHRIEAARVAWESADGDDLP